MRIVPTGANEIHPQALIKVHKEKRTIIKNLLGSAFSTSLVCIFSA